MNPDRHREVFMQRILLRIRLKPDSTWYVVTRYVVAGYLVESGFSRIFSGSRTGDQAVREERQDHQRDADVQPVALPQESGNGKYHACNGRGDQEQQAGLDDAAPFETPRCAGDPAKRAE